MTSSDHAVNDEATCWCGAGWLPLVGAGEEWFRAGECQDPHGDQMYQGKMTPFYCGALREQHQLSEGVHTFVRRVCETGHADNSIEVLEVSQ